MIRGSFPQPLKLRLWCRSRLKTEIPECLDIVMICHAILQSLSATDMLHLFSVVLVSVALQCRFHDLSSPRPTPAGVVKFRSESAFDHAENAAHSVIPGNFGLTLLCNRP